MLELDFQVEGAEPSRDALAPLMLFRLRLAQRLAPEAEPTPVHAVALRCQVRIEPARRRYTPREERRLGALFGARERWAQTVRPLLWTHAGTVVRPFAGAISVELPVPCSYDFALAATRYCDALEGGDIPLSFLFSGTIFYEAPGGALQAVPVPWDREATYRLPAAAWRALMDRHYPAGPWLRLRKDLFDRLGDYMSRRGLPTHERALEALLDDARLEVAP